MTFLGNLAMWCMEYPVHKKIGDMKINHPWGGPWPQTAVGDPSSLGLFLPNKGDLNLHVHLNFEKMRMNNSWWKGTDRIFHPEKLVHSEFQVPFRETHNCTGVPNHGAGSKVFRVWDQIGSPWVESSLFQRSFSLHLSFPFFFGVFSVFFFHVFPCFFWCLFWCFSMFHIHPSKFGPSQVRTLLDAGRKNQAMPTSSRTSRCRISERFGRTRRSMVWQCPLFATTMWDLDGKNGRKQEILKLWNLFFFWIEIHKKHDVAI